MTDVAPFREGPKFLLCPRCGEILEAAFEGVMSCLRCEGLWLTPSTLMAAFGNPRWPAGTHGMWWRDELACPECRSEGRQTVMAALNASGTQIDRCPAHGLWLDRGELGRLMGSTADELAVLREQVTGAKHGDNLAERRAAWRLEADSRHKAADEYRRWLEAEHRRRLDAEATLERERLQARERAAEASPATAMRTPGARAADGDADAASAAREEAARRAVEDQARAAQRLQAERDRARARHELADARAIAAGEVARQEAGLAALRDRVRRTEAELDGARARLRAIDDQLRTLAR